MAKMKILTLQRLNDVLIKSAQIFAPKAVVKQNDDDLNDYVLNITQEWYNANLALDSSTASSSDLDSETGLESEAT